VRPGEAFASGTCTVREHVGLIAFLVLADCRPAPLQALNPLVAWLDQAISTTSRDVAGQGPVMTEAWGTVAGGTQPTARNLLRLRR
jgi:hypothetical protein